MIHNELSLIDQKEKIIWNPAYHIELLDHETVFLCSEHEKAVLKGEAMSALAPFLASGEWTADELIDKMEQQLPPERVFFTLVQLEKKKLIQAHSQLLTLDQAAYCGLLNVSEKVAYTRLKAARVFIKGDEGFHDILRGLSIQLVDDIERADFSIITVHDYLNLEGFSPPLKPWLLCKPYGSEIWIGPFFAPDKKGCYECLTTRLKINRLEESYIQKEKNLTHFFPPTTGMLATTREMAWNLIATEVFKYIVLGTSEHLDNKIQTFNTINFKKQEHHLIPLPQCRHCGTPPQNNGRHLTLTKRKKDVSFRSLSPEETISKFEIYVSPITGVVKYLEPSSSDSPIHVYFSGSNSSLTNLQKGSNLNTFRTNTGGKGTSKIAAKASGLCEALERASGIFHGDEPTLLATYQELKTEALHPDEVLLFSQEQYNQREAHNSKAHTFWKVPDPMNNDDTIPWTPLFSLTENRIKYFPTSCCYYGGPQSARKWKGRGDSNGCAAGNCLEEAILQGFLELIERDSIAIWWYNQINSPWVDLKSFKIPYIERVLEEYTLRNREVWVLDITTDLGIPTFAALSRLKNQPAEDIYMGFGAHLDAENAILRAVTEMNQFLYAPRFWEESCFGEGKQDAIDKQVVATWMQEVKVGNYSYLQNGRERKARADYLKWESSDLLEDINYCRKIVESQGMEFLVLDQTRPEVGLNVVRVVVPGLRHFWPRFAPGRLYDVPVKMGKRSAPLKEHELNPFGVFL